ncbi:MAG: hypothetical protein RIM80_24800 [Alphaproteobacteria bacterium]
MLDLGPWPDGFHVLTHLPDAISAMSPILVSVHGISRNAEEHLAEFRRASAGRAIVLCPQYDAGAFRKYQSLGIGRLELRSDLLLEAALERLRHCLGVPVDTIDLFGFSGGAQFAHRFAMLYPDRIRSLHLAAAGYYTFLDDKTAWPRGCHGAAGPSIIAGKAHFLRLPVRLYIGARDVKRDDTLRKGARIDSQQGPDRLSRARAWRAHIQGQKSAGDPPVTLQVLPRVGHSFKEACRRNAPGLAALVMRAVEGEVRPERATSQLGAPRLAAAASADIMRAVG